jgi:leader peptidase (prepilin peptidase)/N-methyltransferase
MAYAVGAVLFAAAAYVGIVLANTLRLRRFDDGPDAGTPPVAFILGGAAVVGAVVVSHAASPVQIAMLALVGLSLAAIWCTDIRYGIVPDAFTLGPLAVILAYAGWTHEWSYFSGAAVPFVPFAAAAALSGGRGMGWGDVKIAALGGAVLGAQNALLAFAFGCIVAAMVNFAQGRRGVPIAFAPYLACAIALGIPAGVLAT